MGKYRNQMLRKLEFYSPFGLQIFFDFLNVRTAAKRILELFWGKNSNCVLFYHFASMPLFQETT